MAGGPAWVEEGRVLALRVRCASGRPDVAIEVGGLPPGASFDAAAGIATESLSDRTGLKVSAYDLAGLAGANNGYHSIFFEIGRDQGKRMAVEEFHGQNLSI